MKQINRLFLLLFALTSFIAAQQQVTAPKFKFYGFVRNDFFYNSRQNVEAIDGLFHIFPKPVVSSVSAVNGHLNKDVNAVPQAEMLSIATRLGVDITGNEMFGAKSSAKIETDLAGFGTNFYILRIRQAYAKLNWAKTELLIGQTWHPLFGSVMPTTMSLNAGSPFQPFNRSPQIKLKYNFTDKLSVTAAAIYQMQYLSQGPLGSNVSYMKNAMIPNLFAGIEHKTTRWTNGIGADFKVIKPDVVNPASIVQTPFQYTNEPGTKSLTSISAVAYTQYINPKFQFKAKAILGQNLTDHLMMGGYGVSGFDKITGEASKYTNFKTTTVWMNAVYGTKVQIGAFVGWSHNGGTTSSLYSINGSAFYTYGYGNYTVDGKQIILNELFRVTPHISYSLTNLKLGLEYDYTLADYAKMNNLGKSDGTWVPQADNHRIVASVSYFF